MIKIRLPEAAGYYGLRDMYLKRIAKFVQFDKADVLSVETGSKEGKTDATARALRGRFRGLYNFLFREEAGGIMVRRENLRRILVGPDIPPKSLGGRSGLDTMNEDLLELTNQIGAVNDRKVRVICERIFNYKKFVEGQDDAYWFLRTLDVPVCPYCNLVYTTTLPSKEELADKKKFKTTRATFDHFYAKSRYPYLALSLFNLIPCCYQCNGNKGAKAKNIIYPYEEEFGKEVVFRIIPDSTKGSALNFYTGESDQFLVRIMSKEYIYLSKDRPLRERLALIEKTDYRERVHNAVELFHLEELYNEHKPEIKDLMRSLHYFDEDYIKYGVRPLLEKKLKGAGEKNYRERADSLAREMLFQYHVRQDWKIRPLSKLTSDIYDQLYHHN